MINRLIAMTMVCIFALSGAGYAAVKGDDTLPPLVIESDDLHYAGIDIDWSEHPQVSINTFSDVAVYEKPSLNSRILGRLDYDTADVVGGKVYMYPRMGKAVMQNDISAEDLSLYKDIDMPKTGDTVYVIFGRWNYKKYFSEDSLIWYKGNLIEGTALKDSGYNQAKIIKDKENAFELYIIYPDGSIASDGQNRSGELTELGREYSHNSDVWLHINWKEKNIDGWIRLNERNKGIYKYDRVVFK